MFTRPSKPKSYVNMETLDLAEDRRLRLIIYGSALGGALILALIGHLLVPVTYLFAVAGIWAMIFRMVLIVLGIAAYCLLHEYVHSLFIKLMTGYWGKVVFSGWHAHCECSEYFTVKGYLLSTFAPVVLLGLLLTLILVLVPEKLFWPVYIIQIINLAGSAGEYYVAYKLLKRKQNVLIIDEEDWLTIWSE